MACNDWLMQFLADVIAVPVERPRVTETTALGAACLAGLQAGLFSSLDEMGSRWRCERRFEPAADETERTRRLGGWRNAVERTRTAPR
jgi:glycerol kinase